LVRPAKEKVLAVAEQLEIVLEFGSVKAGLVRPQPMEPMRLW